MEKKAELINILQSSPQWILVNQGMWSYFPWALFNCFCSIIDELDPTKKQLQVLLNDQPKILILTATPKKMYTKSLLNMTIDGFEGKESDSIVFHLQQQNQWTSEYEIQIGRLHPVYARFEDFIKHFEQLILQYNPTHVVFLEPVQFDTDLDDKPHIYQKEDIEQLFKSIQELQSVHQIQKLITDQYFYKIPYNQVEKNEMFFHWKNKIPNSIFCDLKMVKGYSDKGEFEVSYRQGNLFSGRQQLVKFKFICYHNGKIRC